MKTCKKMHFWCNFVRCKQKNVFFFSKNGRFVTNVSFCDAIVITTSLKWRFLTFLFHLKGSSGNFDAIVGLFRVNFLLTWPWNWIFLRPISAIRKLSKWVTGIVYYIYNFTEIVIYASPGGDVFVQNWPKRSFWLEN